eukprot:m.19395 g.19395  ORF g.19395 m.19395 type:complete len:63 (-) comp3688_c0_seq2:570-758(-)
MNATTRPSIGPDRRMLKNQLYHTTTERMRINTRLRWNGGRHNDNDVDRINLPLQPWRASGQP